MEWTTSTPNWVRRGFADAYSLTDGESKPSVLSILRRLSDAANGHGSQVQGVEIAAMALMIDKHDPELPVPDQASVVRSATALADRSGRTALHVLDLAHALEVEARNAAQRRNAAPSSELSLVTPASEAERAVELLSQIEAGIHYVAEHHETPSRVAEFFDRETFPDLKALRRLLGTGYEDERSLAAGRAEFRERLKGVGASLLTGVRYVDAVGSRAVAYGTAVQQLFSLVG